MSRRDDATDEPADPPVFAEPWQAQAFALVVALHERGVFTWAEWAEALASQVGQADAAADGGDYYARWLAALETLLARKNVAGSTEIAVLAAAWRRAAQATPHGEPISLENDPEALR